MNLRLWLRRGLFLLLAGIALGVPPALELALQSRDHVAFKAVASASAESKETLMSVPRSRRARVPLADIPDRFVHLTISEPAAAPPAPRQWFPHTWLWRPRLLTDGAGEATVAARLPDSLTRWRLLALSLTEDGVPGGAEAVVATEMPTFIQVSMPARLRRGDRLRLPVTVVNASDTPVSGVLLAELHGTVDARPLEVPAGGSATVVLPVSADEDGSLDLSFTGVDRVVVPVEVVPAGRRLRTRLGGSLGSVEQVGEVDGSRVHLTVLSAPEVLAGSGRSPPSTALAALSAWARACHLEDAPARRAAEMVYRAQTAGVAFNAFEDDELLFALAHALCPAQAPLWAPLVPAVHRQQVDGSWRLEHGADLSQLMGVAALHTALIDAPHVSLNTSVLFERHGGRVDDAFAAGLMLWSTVPEGALAEHLRERLDAAVRWEAGEVRQVHPEGTRADGRPATEMDVLAAVVLGSPPERQPPLRQALASRWSASRHTDAWTDLLVLTALATAPRTELSGEVRLLQGDVVLSEATFEGGRANASVALGTGPLSLDATGLQGDAVWRLDVDRWTDVPLLSPSLAVQLDGETNVQQGVPVDWTARVQGPPGATVTLTHHLPAGVLAVDTGQPMLERTLTLDDGGRGQVDYRLRATLSGRLHDGGVQVETGVLSTWTGLDRAWVVGASSG